MLSEKQIKAITQLPPADRYKHTIKQIADWEEVWGLYDNGWALMGDKKKSAYFPLWPAREYVELCNKEEWENYKAKSINLYAFLDEMIPSLQADNINLVVFPLPESNGITVTYEDFLDHINFELSKY